MTILTDKIISPKGISPARIRRVERERGVRWSVVYPDGQICGIEWDRKCDAFGQASFWLGFHRAAIDAKGGE